jgi:hypothetical protein
MKTHYVVEYSGCFVVYGPTLDRYGVEFSGNGRDDDMRQAHAFAGGLYQ